jgi:copper(I)-binding protein
MKKLACALLLALSAPLAFAGASDEVAVHDPYVRAVPPGQPNSAAFMILENSGKTDHAVVAAKSDASEVVELHTHVMEEGMMKMRQIPQFDLPAGAKTTLEPGGLHVMLIGLKGDLKAGDTVALTLVFADGTETPLQAPVKEIGAAMEQSEHPHPHQH